MSNDSTSGPAGGAFDDVIAANEDYAARYSLAGLKPVAARGLALVTCMDSLHDLYIVPALEAGGAP